MTSWFGNLRLAWKLGIGFGTSLLLTFLLATAALVGNARQSATTETLAAHQIPGLVALQELNFNIGDLRTWVYQLVTADDSKRQVASKAIDEHLAACETAVKSYESTIQDEEDRKNSAELKSGIEAYKTCLTSTEPQLIGLSQEAQMALVKERVRPVYLNKIEKPLKTVIAWNQKSAKVMARTSRETSEKAYLITVVMASLAVLIGVVAAWSVTRMIVVRVTQMSSKLHSLTEHCVTNLDNALSAMATGDLTTGALCVTTPLEVRSRDEIGAMSATFNELLRHISGSIDSYNKARASVAGLIGQISSSVKVVATSSSSLSDSSRQSKVASSEIAMGSEKLAVGATEAASIMEELTAQTSQVKASSEDQETLIEQASSSLECAGSGVTMVAASAQEMTAAAQEGNQAVLATVSAMDRVQQKVNLSSTKVQELDAKGKQIGEIVASIQAIAEQTNLLALNAAIEAARAGEHGRGFAVVADEVRKLAEHTATATKQIGQLVQGVTATVKETVHAIESTTSEVSEGAQRTASAGQMLQQILASAEHVADQSEEVAKQTMNATAAMNKVANAARQNVIASEEMATGAMRVAGSIANVAAVSEETAAGAEQLNASIEEVFHAADNMSRMSQDLELAVSKFRLEETPQTPTLRRAA